MSANTVFIIGAGASEEANLPTGNELKNIIAQMLNMEINGDGSISGDKIIYNALKDLVTGYGKPEDIELYSREALHIRDAMPQAISIDNFIDTHRDNDKIALCGKLAIVCSILDAEQKSLLHFEQSRIDSNIDFISLEKTWYIPFFQLIAEGCNKNDLKERFKLITLIIFNYDRCIEHFIYHALLNYYRISEGEAKELVESINIYHPYGNVGTLPWLNRDEVIEFGKKPTAQELLKLTKKIKTFTEGTDPSSSEILKIKQCMAMANRVVFIGFAFHKLNMQLIAPGSRENVFSPRCYATTYGRSDNDKLVIEGRIIDLFNKKIPVTMSNVSCSQFFKDFWLSLAF